MTDQAYPAAAPAAPQPTGLASPLGMSIIIPLLVLITGLAIGIVNRAPIQHGAEKAAADAFALSTERTRHRLSDVLGQSGPVLDAMRALVKTQPAWDDHKTIATTMLGIIRGRSGVTLVSWSTDDGHHVRVYAEKDHYRYQQLHASPNNILTGVTWIINDQGELLQEVTEVDAGYDPRKRPYYLSATTIGARTWTNPYRFFSSGLTGITCAEPVAKSAHAPAGVLAVDFHLRSISTILDGIDKNEKAASFIFTQDRVMLGMPSSWSKSAAPNNSLFTAQDVKAPDLKNYFITLPSLPATNSIPPLFLFDVADEACVASVSAINLPNGPTWYLGVILRRSVVLGEADYYLQLSLYIGLGILLLATIVALWFARHLARSRLAVVSANRRADKAETKAQELGAYRLIKLLGKGGMGEVWLAQHRMLARPAAIKLIKAETIAGRDKERSEEIRQRFATEARITANLNSQHTIQLYDYGIAADGTFYYVMELLDGIDLYDLVVKFGPLQPGRVVDLLIQACHSLAEAHDNGLVHRDIKPENLYICRRADDVDLLKVLDFGIVRVQNPDSSVPLTKPGMVQGTPTTMSPEQATDQTLDGRSDLYSLGCVAYWLLTAKQVFDAPNAMELLTDHVQAPVTPPSKRTTRPIPEALEDMVMLLLEKDPNKRPLNARVCAQMLRQISLPETDLWDEDARATWWQEHLPPRKLDIPVDSPSQLFALGTQSG